MTHVSSLVLVLALTSIVCAAPKDGAPSRQTSGALAGQVGLATEEYFYSDYCNSWVRSLSYNADGTTGGLHQWLDRGLGSIVSFGEDAQGELYICSSNGRVYRIIKSAM